MKRDNSTRDAREACDAKFSIQCAVRKISRLCPHRLRTNAINKGDAKRRHKSSTGMRGSRAKDVGPHQHTSHTRAAFDPARNAQKHFELCLHPHRLKTNSRALVQLPAHWNGGRCPKGEILAGGVSRSACLSDRRERVSFRQRRAVNSQGGMTGRRFLPLRTFHSFSEKKESARPWNRIPEMETAVCFGHVRICVVGPPLHEAKLFLRDAGPQNCEKKRFVLCVGPHRMGNTFTSRCGSAAK